MHKLSYKTLGALFIAVALFVTLLALIFIGLNETVFKYSSNKYNNTTEATVLERKHNGDVIVEYTHDSIKRRGLLNSTDSEMLVTGDIVTIRYNSDTTDKYVIIIEE